MSVGGRLSQSDIHRYTYANQPILPPIFKHSSQDVHGHMGNLQFGHASMCKQRSGSPGAWLVHYGNPSGSPGSRIFHGLKIKRGLLDA